MGDKNLTSSDGQQRFLKPAFIPTKRKITKPTLVAAEDPFVTDGSLTAYCSLFSTEEDGLPDYMIPYRQFVENVLPIPENILNDINKVQIERECEQRERDQEKKKKVAEQEAQEIGIKNALDKQVSSVMTGVKYFVKRSCPVKIKFKSTLTHAEHEAFVRAFIKFQMRSPVTSLEKVEYQQYLQMQDKVFSEQACLMNFSFEVSKLTLKDYNSVPNVMERYIKDHVLHRCQRATAYQRFYRSEMEIPLKPHNANNSISNFQLRHMGHLLSLGIVPLFGFPNKQRFKMTLPKDETVRNQKPPDCDENYNRSKFLYKCPVSADPNAEFLAKEHRASIVISASAFKTIVDNQEQPFVKDWNIPVNIKSYNVKGANGKEEKFRVVYIDKPLTRKSWLPLQKKFTFFKKSAQALLTKTVNKPFFKMPLPPYNERNNRQTAPTDNVYGDSVFDITRENASESFGSEYSPIKMKQKEKQEPFVHPKDYVASDLYLSEDDDDDDNFGRQSHNKKRSNSIPHKNHFAKHKNKLARNWVTPNKKLKAGASQSKSDPKPPPVISCSSKFAVDGNPSVGTDDGGFLNDLLSKQDGFLKPKPIPAFSYEALNSSGSMNSGSNLKYKNKPWSNSLPTDWTQFEIKKCPKNSGVNVHYQLFSFENNENSSAKHHFVEPIRVLVRHNIHGISNVKEAPSDSKAIVIYPKIENQVYFGCEVNSLSEIIQQWASLVIRPNTTLMQVRACVESGSILMTDERTLESVLKEGKQSHINFQAQSAYAVLNALFHIIMKMESGDYVLHHSANTGAFIKLLKADNTEASSHHPIMDLHKTYMDGAVTSLIYKISPWLAIDTHVLTPFHMIHKKIPGTFPMDNPPRKLTKKQRKMKTAAANAKLSIKELE